jgi:hypothetical protein
MQIFGNFPEKSMISILIAARLGLPPVASAGHTTRTICETTKMETYTATLVIVQV